MKGLGHLWRSVGDRDDVFFVFEIGDMEIA